MMKPSRYTSLVVCMRLVQAAAFLGIEVISNDLQFMCSRTFTEHKDLLLPSTLQYTHVRNYGNHISRMI